MGLFKREKGPKLSGERLKMVAMSGLYSMQQTASLDTLSTGLGTLKCEGKLLKRAWGITDSKSAEETLNYLVSSSDCSEILFGDYTVQDLITVLRNAHLLDGYIGATCMEDFRKNPVWKYFVEKLKEEHVVETEEEVFSITSLAWDLGRLVFVARLCYDAGFIDEKKAWDYIRIAGLKQSHFKDWKEFSKSYMIGRTMWNVEYNFIPIFKGYADTLLVPGNIWAY